VAADGGGVSAHLRQGFGAQPSLLGLPAFAKAMAGLPAEASAKAGFMKNDDFCTREKTSYIKAVSQIHDDF
jgi:hypothetical protein